MRPPRPNTADAPCYRRRAGPAAENRAHATADLRPPAIDAPTRHPRSLPMGYEAETIDLLQHAVEQIGPPPAVRALILPPQRPDDTLSGESCAVQLDDGSIGLSYVLYGDVLPRLRGRAAGFAGADAMALAAGFAADPAADGGIERTLGLAATNALTAWVYGRVGYSPPPAGDSIASIEPRQGEQIGRASCRERV